MYYEDDDVDDLGCRGDEGYYFFDDQGYDSVHPDDFFDDFDSDHNVDEDAASGRRDGAPLISMCLHMVTSRGLS